MQVTFKSNQTLGNKEYKAGGPQTVPDHLAANIKFKALVKSGQVVIVAKNADAQALQKLKDEQNAKKAERARVLAKKLAAEKAKA